MMHERAHGIPRTISVIADNALLAGYANGQRPVGLDVVDRDLSRLRPARTLGTGGAATGSAAAGRQFVCDAGHRNDCCRLTP